MIHEDNNITFMCACSTYRTINNNDRKSENTVDAYSVLSCAVLVSYNDNDNDNDNESEFV